MAIGCLGSCPRQPGRLWAASCLILAAFAPSLSAGPAELYREALGAFRDGQYFTALTAIRKALREEPDNPAYLHLCGLTLAGLRQYSEAEANLQRAVDLAPRNADLQSDFAMVLLRQGKEQQALPLLERAVELDGDNLMARLYLGRTLHNLDYSRRARVQFEAILNRDPRFPSLHYHLAKLHLNEGASAEALEELRLEVRHHPENHLAQFELGELLVRIGRPDEALRHLSAAEPAAQRLDRLYLTQAKALRALGNLEAAIQAVRRGIEIHPQLADNYYLLGQIHLQKGEATLARESLEKFQQLNRPSPP